MVKNKNYQTIKKEGVKDMNTDKKYLVLEVEPINDKQNINGYVTTWGNILEEVGDTIIEGEDIDILNEYISQSEDTFKSVYVFPLTKENIVSIKLLLDEITDNTTVKEDEELDTLYEEEKWKRKN